MDHDHLSDIRRAYDQDVDDFRAGVDPLSRIPEALRTSEEAQKVLNKEGVGSADPEYKVFLDPQSGMKFLDVGSCANLFNGTFDEWPSTYYGIDISPKLVEAMQGVAESRKIPIGGLFVADVANMPFQNNFFDIAEVIGVLEYFDGEYIQKAMQEMHRVMKPKTRMIFDMPNLDNPAHKVMMQLEEFQGRKYPEHIPTQQEIVDILEPFFSIVKIDASRGMTAYFVQRK